MEKSVLSVLCLLLLPVLGSETSGSPAEMAQDQSGVPSKAEVWGYGVLMVTVISLASVAGVVVMPVIEQDFLLQAHDGADRSGCGISGRLFSLPSHSWSFQGSYSDHINSQDSPYCELCHILGK